MEWYSTCAKAFAGAAGPSARCPRPFSPKRQRWNSGGIMRHPPSPGPGRFLTSLICIDHEHTQPAPIPRFVPPHCHRRGICTTRVAGAVPQGAGHPAGGPRVSAPDGFLHEQPQRAGAAHHALFARPGPSAFAAHGRVGYRCAGDRHDLTGRANFGPRHCGGLHAPSQRHLGRCRAPPPQPFCGHDFGGSARPAGLGQRDRARCQSVGHAFGDHQFAHPW